MYVYNSGNIVVTIKQIGNITRYSVPLGTNSFQTESRPSLFIEHLLDGFPSFYLPIENSPAPADSLGTREIDTGWGDLGINCTMERGACDTLIDSACLGWADYDLDGIKYSKADRPPRFDINVYQNVRDAFTGELKREIPIFPDLVEKVIFLKNVVFLKSNINFDKKRMAQVEDVAFTAKDIQIFRNWICDRSSFVPYGSLLETTNLRTSYIRDFAKSPPLVSDVKFTVIPDIALSGPLVNEANLIGEG